MRIRVRTIGYGAAVVCCAFGAMGCASSSHLSVRTYEYRDDGQVPTQAPQGELTSEYQMQSPGEMVSPGSMIADPDGGR